MSNVTDRLNHIANVAKARDEKLKLENRIKFQKCKLLIDQIESKSKEVFPDLFKIACSLVSHGYLLGDRFDSFSSPTFCTDGIYHRLGFYLKSGNPYVEAKGSMPVAFGCQGGGWNGKDFKVDISGKVVSYDYDHAWCRGVMEGYCSELDEFCEKFYAWVDSLK